MENESLQVKDIIKLPRIKVCGMTEMKQLQQLDELGVDFAGFIFYPKSPRFVEAKLKGAEVKTAGLKLKKVGVFVNVSYDEVMQKVDDYGLDMVQLHGDETPFICEQLSKNITVIKAFRVVEGDNIGWKTKDYFEATDMYLFDTEGSGYGGTGKKFDWKIFDEVSVGKPFFLSGGIQPGDAADIKAFMKHPAATDLYAVDINSKFEVEPGVKDIAFVKSFVNNLRDTEN